MSLAGRDGHCTYSIFWRDNHITGSANYNKLASVGFWFSIYRTKTGWKTQIKQYSRSRRYSHNCYWNPGRRNQFLI